MAVRFTKVELAKLRKKHSLFKKYLPTLQLKKLLLQAEVNKAKEEIQRYRTQYELTRERAIPQAKLMTDLYAFDLNAALQVEELVLSYENIVGIQVPTLEKAIFRDVKTPLAAQPAWIDDAIVIFQGVKEAYERIQMGFKKKAILEHELRVVSIRVNLFEKRLIPEIERDINRIRIFLGDQDLQAVASAKVSKNKTQARKLEEGESA